VLTGNGVFPRVKGDASRTLRETLPGPATLL